MAAISPHLPREVQRGEGIDLHGGMGLRHGGEPHRLDLHRAAVWVPPMHAAAQDPVPEVQGPLRRENLPRGGGETLAAQVELGPRPVRCWDELGEEEGDPIVGRC